MAAETGAVIDEKPAVGAAATLFNRFIIKAEAPLAELSQPEADAFAVEDRKDPAHSLFALICNPKLPARVNVMRALKGAQSPGLMQMVEWGVTYWPPLNRQCLAIIYERPVARVMTSLSGEVRRIDDPSAAYRLVGPLVAAIRELTSRGVTHRSIRPTNLFYADEKRERIVLGDCATAPPAYDQPLVFETIESGMAQAFARGSGNYSNDLYSLGVSLLFMMIGRNPVAGLDEDVVLKSKIAMGSYQALVRDERLPLQFIELLRGLLLDEPDDRWTLEALDQWLGGSRVAQMQSKVEKRAQRAFTFNGKEYWNRRDLSSAMSDHWELAIPLIMEGQLEIWLRRAVDDKEQAEVISSLVKMATSAPNDNRSSPDMILTKTCMLLDPAAPIRYKGFHAMPDGFGSALATIQIRRGDLKLFSEMILRDVPKMWFESQNKYSPEASIWDQIFRSLKNYLQQPGLGFGVERVLYETNEALPCQSPLVGEEFVVEINHLLPALNNYAKKANPKESPIDRHVAAFIYARFGHDIEKYLSQLNDTAVEKQTMGVLNLLALLQHRLGPETVPHLAAWLGSQLGPVINAFHSKDRRRELEAEIPRLVRRGSLIEIYQLLDDAEARAKDKDGYGWAVADYAAASKEIGMLEGGETDAPGERAVRVGRQSAATVSVLIGLLSISIMIIMRAW